MLKKASLVDKIDRITGPLSFLLMVSGSENLRNAGFILSTLEVVALKTPFVLDYLSNTKDYKALAYWIPKEILSNYSPINALLDIFPVYKWRCENFYKN